MRTVIPAHHPSQERDPASLAALSRAISQPAFGQHPLLRLQRTIGNQATLRMLRTQGRMAGAPAAASAHAAEELSSVQIQAPIAPVIQTKLIVNEPGDEHEQEADRVAEQVMRMAAPVHAPPMDLTAPVSLQPKCACGGTCDKCQANRKEEDHDDHEELHRSPADASHLGQATAPPIVEEVLRSPGEPLNPETRAFMEPRFGRDFGGVRIHTDSAAASSAESVNAQAYAVQNHIAFGANQYSPSSDSGKTLLAHELTHVVQQREGKGVRIQRQPVPVKALEPLEAVANRIARMAVSPSLAKVNLQGGPGPVLSVVRNLRTGKIHVGLNTGTPATPTKVIEGGIKAQQARINAGEVNLAHTAKDAMAGGHAEVNALDPAIAEEEAWLGHAMTEEEVAATFEMHNVWLSGKNKFATAARCEHCRRIARGVSVTESLFKAEGGVSGTINVPQGGPGGTPEIEPGRTMSGQPPGTAPEVKVQGEPSVGRTAVEPTVGGSAIKLAIAEITVNVLLFAVTYYVNKWYAERQARHFNNDLRSLLPEVNTIIKNREGEIVRKSNAFPLTYGNITIVFSRPSGDKDTYNEGSMSIQNFAVSHQNYQTPEEGELDLSSPYDTSQWYSLTFSLPLFDEKAAEKGASSLVRDYRKVREVLTDTAYKVRLSGVITLYKLAKQDSSLETLVVRDLLGMLKDEEPLVREVAVLSLSQLKAKIAIQYIREVISRAGDDKQRNMLQSYLRELEQE